MPAFGWDKPVSRRTVYGKISRFRLDRMLSLFDFPDPNITCEQRASTNVPPQKLFFLNSELAGDAARALSARLQAAAPDDPERIDLAYQLLFARPPSAYEKQRGSAFLAPAGNEDPSAAWRQYAQMLLSSNEFSFLD